MYMIFINIGIHWHMYLKMRNAVYVSIDVRNRIALRIKIFHITFCFREIEIRLVEYGFNCDKLMHENS